MVRAGVASLLRPTDAAFNAAGRLGIGVEAVIFEAQRLWDGCRLDTERDRRLGTIEDFTPDVIRARRGRITRALLAELRAAVKKEPGTHGAVAVVVPKLGA